MSPEDEAFFKEFGERLAEFRRKRGLTQTELADLLGLKQPRILSFEKGRRRMPLSHLQPFAEALGVSVEELLGIEGGSKRRRKRGPPSKLERQMQVLRELPQSKQRFISKMIDAALQAEQSG